MALIDDVKKLVSNITGVPPERLSGDSSIENLGEWDSMAHVNIILSLEQHYSIAVAPDAAAELISIDAIVDFLNGRTDR